MSHHSPFIHQSLSNRVGMLASVSRDNQGLFGTPPLRKAVSDLANSVLICTIGQLKVDERSLAHEQLDMVQSFLLCVGPKLSMEYLIAIARVLNRCEDIWQDLKA